MSKLDIAENKFGLICNDVQENIHNIETEEDAKIQIINRVLHECLNWPYTDFRAETHHENGFSDYILVDSEKPVLLIEAKRIGILGIKTAEKSKIRYLKISGSSLQKAKNGIEQASSYSLTNGIPIAVLTDGLTWIIFKTFIQGANFKSKEAVVFPSIDAIKNDFSYFYDLLSKQQFGKKIYNAFFDDIHHKRILLTQKLTAPLNESDIKLSKKSELAFDLDRVFSNFFSKLIGDDDDALLIECFVETRESVIADFSLEKITTNVLGNLSPSDRSVDTELTSLIIDNIESSSSESGQTIFIVGPTGAGKTTFLERFFLKTLPSNVRKRCVLIRVDCLNATGRESTALDWIVESLITGLEEEVYENGTPLWDDLLGLYHGEYKRRSLGVDAQLYNKCKEEFKIKFGEFLDKKVEEDREGYLKRILEDVVKNRKMLPIILIDNTDEFTIEYKQKIFQLAQSLRRHINHCLIIFPITDKSAWSLSKTDIFGIYRSKSFFLPTPSPREIFRKRIDYLKGLLSKDEIGGTEKKEYLLGKGIRVSIENLDGFAKVLENIFVDHDYTSKTIGELTNYNIRRTLLLSQRIITSPVIKIEDLVKSYLLGSFVTTKFSRFMDALIKGDYDVYRQAENHEIYPIFQVDGEVRQSPLLKLRILSLLDSAHKSNRSIDKKHLSVQSVVDYFDSIGSPESAIDRALLALLEAGLIEPYDASNKDLSNNQKFTISHRGGAHLRLALHSNVFFYQMAITTNITDLDCALKIKDLYTSNRSFELKLESIKSLFHDYLIQEDKKHISVETDHDKYECQRVVVEDLKKFIGDNQHSDDVSATLGKDYEKGIIKKGIVATVEYFDEEKGYGFAEVDDVKDKIFFHLTQLKEFGVETIRNGDDILCDLIRGDKGFSITNINDIETNESEVVDCSIIRYFPDRSYGFVKIKDTGQSAFFHATVFLEKDRTKIEEGYSLRAEISSDRRAEGLFVKHVVSHTFT